MFTMLSNIYRKINPDTFHHQFKKEVITKWLKSLPNGSSLIDIGSGNAPYKKYCGHLHYISLDFCKYDGTGDNIGVQIRTFEITPHIIADVTTLPVKDQSVDAVLCTEVLEHTYEPLKVIEDMNRILKIGGIIIITVPVTSFLHFSPYHYYSGFKINFFKEFCRRNKLHIKHQRNIGNIFSLICLYFYHCIRNIITDPLNLVLLLPLFSLSILFRSTFMQDFIAAGVIVICQKKKDSYV